MIGKYLIITYNKIYIKYDQNNVKLYRGVNGISKELFESFKDNIK